MLFLIAFWLSNNVFIDIYITLSSHKSGRILEAMFSKYFKRCFVVNFNSASLFAKEIRKSLGLLPDEWRFPQMFVFGIQLLFFMDVSSSCDRGLIPLRVERMWESLAWRV